MTAVVSALIVFGLAALAEWLPDVLARGFAIVPVSAIAVKLEP